MRTFVERAPVVPLELAQQDPLRRKAFAESGGGDGRQIEVGPGIHRPVETREKTGESEEVGVAFQLVLHARAVVHAYPIIVVEAVEEADVESGRVVVAVRLHLRVGRCAWIARGQRIRNGGRERRARVLDIDAPTDG